MKTVVGATAGARREQLSAATCLLKGRSATAVTSSATAGVDINPHQGGQDLVYAKGDPWWSQFQSPSPETNLYYCLLKEVAPVQEGRRILFRVRPKPVASAIQPPSKMVYTLWTAIGTQGLGSSESAELASIALVAGGAATVNEAMLVTEGPPPRWSELALSAFPRVRGMTAKESAAYRAFKQRVFRRR